MEYETEEHEYRDEILWDGSIYEIIQVGSITTKEGKEMPLLYAVKNKYPYEIKIFYEKDFGDGRKILFDLAKKLDLERYQAIVANFQKEIINNVEVDEEYKIFDSKERLKYERKKLKGQKEALTKKQLEMKKREEEAKINFAIALNEVLKKKLRKEEALKRFYDTIKNRKKAPKITPEEEAETIEFFKNVSYSIPRKPKR